MLSSKTPPSRWRNDNVSDESLDYLYNFSWEELKMIKYGIADYGLLTWYGGFFDNEDRLAIAQELGFDGWVFLEHDTHLRDPKLDLKESFDIMKRWESEV